jgi:hypothetical protein
MFPSFFFVLELHTTTKKKPKKVAVRQWEGVT